MLKITCYTINLLTVSCLIPDYGIYNLGVECATKFEETSRTLTFMGIKLLIVNGIGNTRGIE